RHPGGTHRDRRDGGAAIRVAERHHGRGLEGDQGGRRRRAWSREGQAGGNDRGRRRCRVAEGGRGHPGRRQRGREARSGARGGKGSVVAAMLVYAELSEGKVATTSLELMAKARELGDVCAVALGS